MPENTSASTTPKRRGRPPKSKVVETNNLKVADKKGENEYEFSSYQNSIALSDNYFGLNIFDLYSAKDLQRIVQDPINNNKLLRDISLVLYGSNGTYTNTVDYMTAMPTLDNVVVTHGKNNTKKKKNKEIMLSTLRTIKHKEVIRDALFRGMIEGVAFYYFETTSRPTTNRKTLTDYDVENIVEINELGINASIISLPTDYTRIIGIKNSSYVIAFNLDYFYNGDGEPAEQKIRKYPKEIRDALKRRQSGKLEGSWVVLDNTKTIVHKIRSKRDEKWGRPLVLAAISDILYGDYYTDTKRNVLDEVNNKIIYQTFPEGKDKGTSALNKTQQQNQHEAVKSAVQNKNNRRGNSFVSVAAGTKLDVIDASNTDILDDSYESDINSNVALDLGIASALLNGVASGSYSSQENNLELLSSQIFMWIEQIESELNKCISANVVKDKNNWVECRYLHITNVNKSKMIGYAKDLYLQGNGSISLWAATVGVSPDVFFALLDEEEESNVYEKYTPHQTSYTLSSKETDPGRPETDEPTDSAMATRESRLGQEGGE